ncbi:MAG: BCCT family transporter [Flavobacteriales bacterium AspAUS03]
MFILFINGVLSFFYLEFNKYRRMSIGGPEARPEFSKESWFAMLFSARI